MGLPMVGIHTGSDLSRTSYFGSYSNGGYDSDIVVDSDGNKYVCYSTSIVAKYDSNGTLLWQKSYDFGSKQGAAYCSYTDTILVVSIGVVTAASGAILTKIDTNGDVVWSKGYDLERAQNGSYVVTNPNNGQIAISNWYGPVNNDYGDLAVFNSSGTLQWRRQITEPNLYTNVRGGTPAFDSSGNVYLGCHTYTTVGSGASWESYMFKFFYSGSVAWQKKLYHPTESIFLSSGTQFVPVVGAEYVYFYGFVGFRRAMVVQVSASNGALISQKQFPSEEVGYIQPWGFKYDGTNLYAQFWGTLSGDSYNKSWIVELDSSLSIVSQRSISFDSSSVYAYGLNVDDSHIYVDGYGPLHWDLKIPKDGSKAGVYPGIGHTLTYSESNISIANSIGTLTNGSLSASSVTPTVYTLSASSTTVSNSRSLRKF